MSIQAQITCNRQNAQSSTGPTTEAGKQISSQNANRHGFTGLSLIVTPAEKEAYDAHVQAYMDHHQPADHIHRQVVQQVAPIAKTLNTLNLYETRRRRALKTVQEELDLLTQTAVEAQAKLPAATDIKAAPPKIGSVHSSPQNSSTTPNSKPPSNVCRSKSVSWKPRKKQPGKLPKSLPDDPNGSAPHHLPQSRKQDPPAPDAQSRSPSKIRTPEVCRNNP